MSRQYRVLALILFLLFPAALSRAENAAPSKSPFSVTPSREWIKLDLPLQGMLVSYGKKGTLATFHISERDLDGAKSLGDLRWEDLFNPQFSSIAIRKQGEAILSGEKSKFCIYTLKPGEFRDTMEGKLPGKYINYVLIHGGKLISITFKDTEDGFALNYPSFLTAIRTLRFDTPAANPRRKSL